MSAGAERLAIWVVAWHRPPTAADHTTSAITRHKCDRFSITFVALVRLTCCDSPAAAVYKRLEPAVFVTRPPSGAVAVSRRFDNWPEFLDRATDSANCSARRRPFRRRITYNLGSNPQTS